ncbi:MAG: shikimate kinase [Ilumatobacteraceae bacterium]
MLTRSIVLIGLTGSGKTTVGKRLAKQLNCSFIDSDDVVLQLAGKSVRDIFEQQGEQAFRDLESRALEAIFADHSPKVIAAAGGSVLAESNRQVITNSDSTVVWLDVEPSNLLRRVTVGSHRPLLDGDTSATLTAMSAERRSLYAQLADLQIDANVHDINQVVRTVLDHVAKRDNK